MVKPFDKEEWKRKVKEAKTGDELAALVMELPRREWHELSEEEQEFVLFEEAIEAELFALMEKRSQKGSSVK